MLHSSLAPSSQTSRADRSSEHGGPGRHGAGAASAIAAVVVLADGAGGVAGVTEDDRVDLPTGRGNPGSGLSQPPAQAHGRSGSRRRQLDADGGVVGPRGTAPDACLAIP